MLSPVVVWPVTLSCIVPIYIVWFLIYQAKKRTNRFGIWIDQLIPQPLTALEREIQFAKYITRINRIKHVFIHIYMGLIFYTFPDSILMQNMDTNNYNFNIIFHSTQLLSVITYFITSLIDPGVIKHPDASSGDIQSDEFIPILTVMPHWRVAEPDSSSHENKFSHLEPIEIYPDNAPSSFCWRCLIMRPLRAKHDYDIDKCVAVWSHHNEYIGNSIAAKNYRYFLLWWLLDTIFHQLSLYIIIDALMNFSNNNYTNMMGWIIMILTCIFVTLWTIPAMMIFGLHTYLISINKTLWERRRPHFIEQWADTFQELTTEFMSQPDHADAAKWKMADIVNGFIKEAQLLLPFEDNSYYNIPPLVNNICIDYYYDVMDFYKIAERENTNFNKGFVKNWKSFLNGYKERKEWFVGLRCWVKEIDSQSDQEN